MPRRTLVQIVTEEQELIQQAHLLAQRFTTKDKITDDMVQRFYTILKERMAFEATQPTTVAVT